ncbi:MAG: GNAT family N-acetyltransferase [Nocardioidaceae bacterium]|nr:GNAT family N-acetyltransferase [Nocardioidaceae bacterium]
MQIALVDPQGVHDDVAGEFAEVVNAARAVDSPHESPVSAHHEKDRLRFGWDDRGADYLLLARHGGQLAGYAELYLPRWDNPHLATMSLETHPAGRGQGVGDALLREALSLVAQEGRTVVLGDAWADSHRAAFWQRHGFEVGSRDAQRRLVMTELDWPRLEDLHRSSLEASTAYDIIELPMPAPADMMDGLLELHRAMNDAPTDDLLLEDDMWSEDRARGYEQAMEHRGIRLVRLVARRRGDGELGGHTVVAIEDERPHLGFQEDTAVVAGHRGHKLGLRLKIEMLKLLADRERQVTLVDTWNAESNAHMIAVNDGLGCTVVGRGVEYQKDLATAAQ